jgi:hypothetical protein
MVRCYDDNAMAVTPFRSRLESEVEGRDGNGDGDNRTVIFAFWFRSSLACWSCVLPGHPVIRVPEHPFHDHP